MSAMYKIDNDNFAETPTGRRVGQIILMVGTFWAFRGEQRAGETDDLTMFRLIRERAYYRRWTHALAIATALAYILNFFF